ncbi:hypothetical protein GT625_27895, partial [Burkholderia thailandensis]|nr:hypothetical protein [Burkholderia thailandensis]NBJ22484.1 hypothetical protein [Burkholderia thailandensis]NOK56240.1 hypothetical protein [Burkholderia thailandensis]
AVALEAFDTSPWGTKYPPIAALWRRGQYLVGIFLLKTGRHARCPVFSLRPAPGRDLDCGRGGRQFTEARRSGPDGALTFRTAVTSSWSVGL